MTGAFTLKKGVNVSIVNRSESDPNDIVRDCRSCYSCVWTLDF